MKDEKCKSSTTSCEDKKEKKNDGCSTTKPHEEKRGGCGCGTKK